MAEPLRSAPDPAKPVLNATGVLGSPRRQPGFEADFAQLAACLSAQTGGGLPPELSNELALEIVLNEVVEQACVTSGANGAVVALERGGEMICRGCSGISAPRLGSRIDITLGLVAESVRTRRIQRADDILSDPRVAEKSLYGQGVRSLLIMPLIRDDKLVGLFELLSSMPQAFSDRDERTLEALAFRVFENLDHATQPPPLPLPEPPPLPGMIEHANPAPEASATPEASVIQQVFAESPIADPTPTAGSPSSEFDVVTWALRAAIVVCTIVLGLLLGRHLIAPNAKLRSHPAASSVTTTPPIAPVNPQLSSNTPQSTTEPVQANTPRKQEDTSQNSGVSQPRTREKAAPPGSLEIFENGKEVFRMPPQGSATEGEPSLGPVQRASSSEPETAAKPSPDTLIHRVEPEYPANALAQKIEGAVVLDVQINRDGAVQDVQVVGGAPELVHSSVAAVKQWQFQPRLVNGRRTPMQTRVTLNYKLPQ